MNKKTVIINQFAGLGDIIFIMPLVRRRMIDGVNIVWPVFSNLVNIQKHFPEIMFVDKDSYPINYNEKKVVKCELGTVIPYRWSDQIANVPYKRCMESKYLMDSIDMEVWRESSWIRDNKAEEELFNKLGLVDGEEYALINDTFTTKMDRQVGILIPTGIKTIKMRAIDNYTLFDWGKVIQNATIIHTVGTSINYVMELLDLKAKEIHLYIRYPQEKDFENYDYLLSKDYIFHI